jgi:hypothetical protein
VKIRHTAVLALVGWFMLLTDAPFNPSPLLKQTIQSHSPPMFKTEDECELAKKRWLLRGGQVPAGYSLICIASDDPRLKGDAKQTVKPHPTTGSTFAGWYLIVPTGSKPTDLNAPLSQWKIWERYESSSDAKCKYDLQGLWEVLKLNLKVESPGKEAFLAALCVRSDDPRLKGN